MTPRLLLALVLGAFTLTLGCDRGEVREWTPADHDQENDGPGAPVGSNRGGRRGLSAEDQAGLIDVAWGKQCALCHGPQGRGDGPNGPMVGAPDLTRKAWQTQVTDEQIAATIQQGKGRMPRFDLPVSVVAGLVRRIRANQSR